MTKRLSSWPCTAHSMTDVEDAPDHVGFTVTDESDARLIQDFDEAFECGPGRANSRAEAIRRAMFVMSRVAPIYEEADLEFVSAQDESMFVRQALYDRVRRESE